MKVQMLIEYLKRVIDSDIEDKDKYIKTLIINFLREM